MRWYENGRGGLRVEETWEEVQQPPRDFGGGMRRGYLAVRDISNSMSRHNGNNAAGQCRSLSKGSLTRELHPAVADAPPPW